jgi:hypothetical protein
LLAPLTGSHDVNSDIVDLPNRTFLSPEIQFINKVLRILSLLLKCLRIFAMDYLSSSQVDDVTSTAKPSLNGVEIEFLRQFFHAGVIVSRIVHHKVAKAVLEIKFRDDCCDDFRNIFATVTIFYLC